MAAIVKLQSNWWVVLEVDEKVRGSLHGPQLGMD